MQTTHARHEPSSLQYVAKKGTRRRDEMLLYYYFLSFSPSIDVMHLDSSFFLKIVLHRIESSMQLQYGPQYGLHYEALKGRLGAP